MPVQVSAPAPTSGDIKLLGAGRATSTVGAGVESLGSFSTSGDIGNGYIYVIISFRRITGADATMYFKISNANNDISNDAYRNTLSYMNVMEYKFLKRIDTGTETGIVCEVNNTTDEVKRAENAMFTLSAAETFYINVQQYAASTADVVWSAFLVGSGVK